MQTTIELFKETTAMSILSLIWGISSICILAVGFFPCLGALNWLGIPFSFLGFIVSIFAYMDANAEKGQAMVGIVGCSVAVIFGIIRLIIGGGIV